MPTVLVTNYRCRVRQLTRLVARCSSLQQYYSCPHVQPSRTLTDMRTSALYIRGKEARNRRALLLPYIELDKIVNELPALQKTLQMREIDLDITSLSEKLPSLRIVKNELKRVQMEIMQLTQTLSDYWKPANESLGLQSESELKKDLQAHYVTEREVKQSMYAKEEEVIPIILGLPNFVRPPSDAIKSACVEYGNRTKHSFPAASHVDVGGANIILRNEPRLCYLKGEPALLHLLLCRFFNERLETVGSTPLNGPDWVVDAVVEGCGTNPNDLDSTMAIESKEHSGGHHMHLVGSAALESFAAYFTRRQPKDIPAKFHTVGCRYIATCDALLPGLFSLAQSTKAASFMACRREELLPTFEKLLMAVKCWYQELELPFRMVLADPPDLGFIESLRVSIEVWSPAQNKYIPCGFLSLHDDFVSRRLIMVSGAKATDAEFLHTGYACVANIHALVACIMENTQREQQGFTFPAAVTKAN
uniref:Putative seryl-trna synthetase n=1 Tax=Amblyomma triste TaxID=251400 RepID=A0A023GKG1_AMBTT